MPEPKPFARAPYQRPAPATGDLFDRLADVLARDSWKQIERRARAGDTLERVRWREGKAKSRQRQKARTSGETREPAAP